MAWPTHPPNYKDPFSGLNKRLPHKAILGTFIFIFRIKTKSPSTYFLVHCLKFSNNTWYFFWFGAKTGQTAHGVKKQQQLQLGLMFLKEFGVAFPMVINIYLYIWKLPQFTNLVKDEGCLYNQDSQDRNNPCRPPGPWRWRACKHYRARLTKTGPHPSKKLKKLKKRVPTLEPDNSGREAATENVKHVLEMGDHSGCFLFSTLKTGTPPSGSKIELKILTFSGRQKMEKSGADFGS